MAFDNPGWQTVAFFQAEQLRGRLQDAEKLLAGSDCRGRSAERRPPPPGDPTVAIHDNQRDLRALPNALEEFLAFQGNW